MSNLANKNNVCAIIPFYNEADKIETVVRRTLPFVKHVICIDDGSTDNYFLSEEILQNITLIKHSKNFGKGRALNSGFKKGTDLGFTIFITLDGDLQHNPEFIPYLVNEIIKFDIVIGKRNFFKSNMPLPRRFSNFLSSKILSILAGQKILDSQSGFRCIKSEVIKKCKINSDGFEAETELILKASKNKFSIGFVEIPTIYSDNDNSKIKNLNSIMGFLNIIIKFLYERN